MNTNESRCEWSWLLEAHCAHCLGHKPDFDVEAVIYG